MKKQLLGLVGWVVTIILSMLLSGFLYAQNVDVELERGFITPPFSAKPHTWWHWTSGNVTIDGITHDLEWMKRAGIAGFQIADVDFGFGHMVEDKIMFSSPEWLNAVKYAAEEAERLDLEMAIFSSAGWSLAGGPWVKPEQAMKKLVWSEIDIEGPQTFSGIFPHPPVINGPIRNMSRGRLPQTDPSFYDDYAIIAYPTPSAELRNKDIIPVIKCNGKVIQDSSLTDNDLNSIISLPVDQNNNKIIIDFIYHEPVSVQAFTIASKKGIPTGRLMAKDDAGHFKIVAILPGPQLYREGKVRTFSFQEQLSGHFRLEITGAPYTPAQVMHQPPSLALADSFALAEAILHTGARLHRWEDKAGYSFLFDYSSVKSPAVSVSATIDPDQIIDLTNKMDKDGNLTWKVPSGNWTIMRTGYSLTGAKNRPAVSTGLGYEVDKLSKKHVQNYLENYLEPLKDKLGSLFGDRLKYLMMDSWEAGMQNWTENMAEEFRSRRGYELLPYLPVLAGRVVENAEVSDRFLWDFRRTIADLFAENFYSIVTEYMHQNGLKTYGEASGVSLEILEDALLCKKYVDIPMGEFWVWDLHPSEMYHVDIRGAASAAHAYGKKYVAAEAFTGGNYESPAKLKKISDYWFTQGVNRLVFHTSTHQPLDSKPGNAMVGTHIHRNITWAEQASPFITYLARNSFMLQQGLFVADIAYLLDEGAPSTMPFWGSGPEPSPPAGYDYDYVNTDVLLTRMSVDSSGNIVLPDEMSYRLLVLPRKPEMTINVLKKIRELVKAGATIVGPKPCATPGLTNYPYSEEEFQQLVDEVWGDLDGISRTKRYINKGMVVWGESLPDVLLSMSVEKDLEYSRDLNTSIHWIHKRKKETDFYFISSQSDSVQNIDLSFRVSGKKAELWFPGEGIIKDAAYRIINNRTIVRVDLMPNESLFVVFREKTKKPFHKAPEYLESVIAEINDSWKVSFPKGWGAPEMVDFPDLMSWTNHNDKSIKYFSGTANYTNQVVIKARELKEESDLWIDLGIVRDIAEVFINGRNVATLWKKPYKTNVTEYLKPGINQILIRVTNQWTNRLAGDQLVPDEEKVLDVLMPRFMGQWELKESGLLGPVRIISVIPQENNIMLK